MTSSAAHRSVGFVWQCAWRCVPTKGRGKMKSAEKKLRKKSRAGSCQTLAVPESSQAGSQRPAWGVLVSRSMEDVTHAAPSSVCVCVVQGQSGHCGDVKWVRWLWCGARHEKAAITAHQPDYSFQSGFLWPLEFLCLTVSAGELEEVRSSRRPRLCGRRLVCQI